LKVFVSFWRLFNFWRPWIGIFDFVIVKKLIVRSIGRVKSINARMAIYSIINILLFHKMDHQLDLVCDKLGLQAYANSPVIKNVESSTGVKGTWIVLGLSVVLGLFGLSSYGQTLIWALMTYFVPSYMSYKQIGSLDKNGDKKWLTYWVVVALWDSIDGILATLLFWVPYYGLVKFAVLMALYFPQTGGAEMIYDKLVEPLLKEYGEPISQHLGEIEKLLMLTE
jgi:receptor expression-enhancing protein 5/6